jgi:anionic cell wall polymer biosynthesis LytR-Cps2A-Psr (LCP) family protein
MDGRTALSHARNRTIGTDFARSGRQRTVLMAMAKKIREETNWAQRIGLFFRGRKYIRTNLPVTQMAVLGVPVLKAMDAKIPSVTIPLENTYTVSRDENWHFEIDFEENARELEKFFRD